MVDNLTRPLEKLLHNTVDNPVGWERTTRLLPVLIVLLASIHLYCPPTRAAELEVIPDSVEYAVAAHRFATTGRYEIVVNGQALPPRYPPGFSVLFLAPVYALAPGNIGNGIFAVWIAGMLAALFAYLIGSKLAGPWGGVFAAVLLLHHPQFVSYTQLIMTDVPAVALGLITGWLFLHVRSQPKALTYLLAGCVVAVSAAIRPLTGVLVVPFLVDLVWIRRPGIWKHLSALGLPIGLAIAGTSFQQWHDFGDFRRTGYQFWLAVPYDYVSLVFSRRYLHDNLQLISWGPVKMPILLGLIGICSLAIKRGPQLKNAALFLLVGVLPLSIIHLFYFFRDIRFHFLSLALLCVLGGAGAAALIPHRVRQRLWPAPWLVALTLLIPRINQNLPDDQPRIRYQVAMAAAKSIPENAVLISGSDPAYLEQIVARGTTRRILPINRETPYAKALLTPVRIAYLNPPPRGAADQQCPGLVNGGARKLYQFTADEEIGRLKDWVRQGVPVYVELLSTPREHPSALALQSAFQFVPISADLPWLVRLRGE